MMKGDQRKTKCLLFFIILMHLALEALQYSFGRQSRAWGLPPSLQGCWLPKVQKLLCCERVELLRINSLTLVPLSWREVRLHSKKSGCGKEENAQSSAARKLYADLVASQSQCVFSPNEKSRLRPKSFIVLF
uniref:Uncharacterized protein n=1 Tax=Sphaerodactylus townsendi TaxID=933632 RepID=A0ACB8F3Y9_9SAUR